MIKVIIFDLVGVVFERAHMISNVLCPMLGLQRRDRQVLRQYRKFDLGKISEKEFWQPLVGKNYKKFQRKFLLLYKLDPDYNEIIKLRKKYRIALLSNFPSEHGKLLNKKYCFDKEFEQVFFSGDYGLMKGSQKYFKLLLDKLKVKARECAFVADRLADLRTAAKLGIRTIWMRRRKVGHKLQPDYVIGSLKEIKGLRILRK